MPYVVCVQECEMSIGKELCVFLEAGILDELSFPHGNKRGTESCADAAAHAIINRWGFTRGNPFNYLRNLFTNKGPINDFGHHTYLLITEDFSAEESNRRIPGGQPSELNPSRIYTFPIKQFEQAGATAQLYAKEGKFFERRYDDQTRYLLNNPKLLEDIKATVQRLKDVKRKPTSTSRWLNP